MGAGKTVFAKGVALGLGIGDDITSPTYAYMNDYYGKLYITIATACLRGRRQRRWVSPTIFMPAAYASLSGRRTLPTSSLKTAKR